MPHLPASHDVHDTHNRELVAAYAAGDATGRDLDAAASLVATCADCAALHHDLRAIAAATAILPAPARTRDFRLSTDQAASLRPAGWRRLLAPFAGPRFAFAGPLGGGLAALGLAGILIAGGAGIPLGGAASAPASSGAVAESAAAQAGGTERMTTNAGGEPAVAAPPSAVDVDPKALDPEASPAGAQQPVPMAAAQAAPSPAPAGDALGAESGPMATAMESAPVTAPGPDGAIVPLLPALSALLLIVGLGLAGLRIAGRRLAADA